MFLKFIISWSAVENLKLNEVRALQECHVVAISKHLCGPATGNISLLVSALFSHSYLHLRRDLVSYALISYIDCGYSSIFGAVLYQTLWMIYDN